MAGFSAGEAISSGFRLIGRHPAAVLWWAGAYLLLGALPLALAFWSVGPDLIALYQQMGREAALGGAHHADMASMMALQSRMAVLQPVTLLSSLVSHAVLIGAIYRGVLHPEESRFGFVRFSSRELWLGLVMAVLYVGMFVALFAAAIFVAIPLAIVGFAARAAGGGAMAGLLCFLLVLAAIGVLV